MEQQEQIEIIVGFNKLIREIYIKEDLVPLRGKEDDYILNGKNILQWFPSVTTPHSIRNNYGTKYFELLNDLLFCSDEVIFATAHLFLYRPYINNPLEDDFTNRQNQAARRYDMYTDIAAQKLYNYWDRIGDLLASYFPGKIKEDRIFFSTAFDLIQTEFHESENYIWLQEFKNTHYQTLNNIRKQIVHYFSSNSQFTHQFIFAKDEDAVRKLIEERLKIPEFYKEQNVLCLIGFEKTVYLLEEIGNHQKPTA
jgi:hypothetical protein